VLASDFEPQLKAALTALIFGTEPLVLIFRG
jgi:hypothetical protein